ncbi:MAG: hypothetical protein C0467_03665 [Planctomycetaceae bacterium]|nr:hypothetical protein [Planctomycetaceae bacterium]
MAIGSRRACYEWLLAAVGILACEPGSAQPEPIPATKIDTLLSGTERASGSRSYEALTGQTLTESSTAQTSLPTDTTSAFDTLTCNPLQQCKPAPKFGTPGTTHVVFVPLVGKAIGTSEWFYILNVEVDHFFLKNTCVNLHLQGIYYDQPGPPTVGYGPALTLRRYFFVRPKGNVFLAGGVGLTYSDNPVPDVVGSKLNFTPRAAVGFSQELFGGTRLIGGLRVIHSQGLGRSDFSRTILQPFLGLSIVLY